MSVRRLAALAFTVLLPMADPTPAQQSDALPDRLDGFVRTYVEMGVFSGAVLVAKGGEVVLEKGYGMASYSLAVPATPTHRFRVASISKAFTDVAVLRLVEAGALDWEDPVSRYVTDFPRGDDITVRMLATNSSGLAHINDLPWYDQFEFREWSLEEIVGRLAGEPLAFEPGTDSDYSNGGFALLALVLERATGEIYGEVLREQVFEPAEMSDSGHEGHARIVPRLAMGYTYGMDGIQPAPYVEMSLKTGGGSAYSTVGDLYRFARAIEDGRLIGAATADSLFGTIDSPTGHARVYHGGRAPGYTAALVRYPEPDVVIVVLSNNYSRLNEEISDGLAGILFGGNYDNRLGEILSRTPFPAVALEAGQVAAITGAWRHAWGITFDLQEEDGTLVYRDPERGIRHPLIALSPTSFVSPWQWARLEFDSADGKVLTGTMTWLDFPEKAWPLERREREPSP
jgi:CubicO group peptidase (beta-lactamase class C family)